MIVWGERHDGLDEWHCEVCGAGDVVRVPDWRQEVIVHQLNHIYDILAKPPTQYESVVAPLGSVWRKGE